MERCKTKLWTTGSLWIDPPPSLVKSQSPYFSSWTPIIAMLKIRKIRKWTTVSFGPPPPHFFWWSQNCKIINLRQRKSQKYYFKFQKLYGHIDLKKEKWVSGQSFIKGQSFTFVLTLCSECHYSVRNVNIFENPKSLPQKIHFWNLQQHCMLFVLRPCTNSKSQIS